MGLNNKNKIQYVFYFDIYSCIDFIIFIIKSNSCNDKLLQYFVILDIFSFFCKLFSSVLFISSSESMLILNILARLFNI